MARSICIYGPTGSRKTTQVKWFAHYIAEVTGKSTLLLSLSDGGWEPMCTPEVKAGMILPYKGDAAVTPLLALRKMSQGYWPAYPEEANEALLRIASSGGHAENEDLQKASLIPVDFSKIGGIAVEGLTSISSIIMRYLPEKGISVGGENRFAVGKSGVSSAFNQAGVIAGEIRTESFGSSIWGDYNFMKNTISGIVGNYNSLPVHSILYTALESKTTESGEKSGSPLYGPAMDGKKATAECGSWFGDLIHAQDYPLPRNITVPNPSGEGTIEQTVIYDTVRFFYRKHPDPDTNIMFPAKPRCAPEKIVELEKMMPGGYFEPEFGAQWGINRYLSAVDKLSDDASKTDALANWRERMDIKLGRKK